MVKIIGLMSGTSLDGLDMCYAGFELNDNKWEYTIFAAEAEEYPAEIKSKLASWTFEIEKVVEATQYDGCPAEDNIIAYCPNCRNTFSINARNTFFIKE